MTLKEIKDAVIKGLIVHWKTNSYTVIVSNSVYYIACVNNSCVGLTNSNYVLNELESDFYINTL